MKRKSASKKLLPLMLILMLILGISMPANAAANPRLNSTKKVLYVGKTSQLKVVNWKKAVKWSSSNNKVVKVSSKGKITAVKTGTATVKARIAKKTLTCKVTVKSPGMSVKKAVLYVKGKSLQLKVNGVSGKTVWSSANKKIVKVSSKGKITAVKTGTTVVKAKIGKKVYTCKVTVKNPYLSAKSLKFVWGTANTSRKLSIKGDVIKAASSSNTKVAKVKKDGTVSVTGTGTCTVTFKDSKKRTYRCKITVVKPTLKNQKATLEEGESIQLGFKEKGVKVSWSSADQKIATVTKTGVVQAVGEGNTSIVAKVKGIKIFARIFVTKKYVQDSGHEYTRGEWVKLLLDKVGCKYEEQFDSKNYYYADTRENENGIAAARPLWLPALSKEIDIHDINVENIMFAGSIKAVVGMIDNPESQSQYPYYIDFSEFSNLMIVGNQGCGKSTFIQTILYSMAMNYHSDDVNFYILDFSSGLLHNFMKLPHCGNVAQVDEEDSVNRTIRYLISVIEERNQIFKKAGVGGFWEFKKISKEPMPLLLLVIDNYFAFGENYESLEGDITTLLRSGFRCGIQVIVSANRMNDMKFRLRQNITRVVPLQLNERMDYMEALGSYLAGFTATVRGRGLCKEEEILEFQTALVSSEKTEYERIRKVSAEFEAMAKTEKYHARSILVLPENETYGEFLEKMPEEMLEDYIPIGYEQKEIQPYTVSLKESFCYLISGIGRKGVDNLLENTTEYLAATENLPTKKELYLVHLNKNCAIEEERAEAVYKNDEDIFSMLLFLKEEFTKRNKWRKEYLAEGKEERLYSILKKEFAQLFFIIDDFTAFLELVYKSHGTESYFPITELFFKEGKGLGIYFIAGIDTGNSASAVYTQAYKNFTNEKKGIHLGGQLNQQNLFQFQIPITKQLTRLDDNIGCFVEKETPYSVFIPWNQSQ